MNIGQKRRKKRKEMRGGEINYPPHSIKWCSNIRRGDAVGASYRGGSQTFIPDRTDRQTDRQTRKRGRGGGEEGKVFFYHPDPKCSL